MLFNLCVCQCMNVSQFNRLTRIQFWPFENERQIIQLYCGDIHRDYSQSMVRLRTINIVANCAIFSFTHERIL